ncbi:MAG: DUF2130 domain-containing protein [Verrucomicrobiales bacterium]
MKDTTITCPKCGADIPFSEAVSHSVREQFEADFERRLAASNAALEAREQKLEKARASLAERAGNLESEVSTRLEQERSKLAAAAALEAEEKLGLELKALKENFQSQKEKLKLAQAAELALLKQKQELEEAKEGLELKVRQTLDQERKKIAEKARMEGAEAERLKLADKDGVIKGLKEQIAALQQRAEQGSMQLQGESLELTLESDLRLAFSFDEVTEVKKGQRGADIVQRVRTRDGFDCGCLLWEAKRARNWSADWPEKLKDDQRAAKADLAVIVTTSLPEGVRGFGCVEGVWVSEPHLTIALASALRQGLLTAAVQRVQQANRADKAQALYDHLCGVEFRHHVEALVESFVGLRDQLEAEKRSFQKQWKEREQQLQKALNHIAMLYGGVQGIAGREALPEIRTLSLSGPTA